MDVSIIIVTYNTCKMTNECINSIVQYTIGLEYEIILVDNASQDDSYNTFSMMNECIIFITIRIWGLVRLIMLVQSMQLVDIYFY